MRIQSCFDSHVHWPFVGEVERRLNLHHLIDPSDVLKLSRDSSQERGDWWLGFGWDDSKWSNSPKREWLDQISPNQPVAFTRCDGHALWVNQEALKRSGLLEQNPSGVLNDRESEQVRSLIPPIEPREIRHNLLRGMKIFHQAGFTHIRDMTCDEGQWHEVIKLDESRLLTLAVDEYFWLKGPDDLRSTLDLFSRARSHRSEIVKARGIKLFLDGALGSNGAYISHCYHGTQSHGELLWNVEALKLALQQIWACGAEVAAHVIGDEASSLLIQTVNQLKAEGVQGQLHLEHCELMRPETIQALQGLDVCGHFQPSHWLSDKKWLTAKVGSLIEYAFPWRAFQEAGIPFFFGSDAPIEIASVAKTIEALEDASQAGIPRLLGDPTRFMSYPDLGWAANSYTIFENARPTQVVFRGEHLL